MERLAQRQPFLAHVAEWWRPLLTALVLCFVVLVLRPSDSLDRGLSDRLLVRQAQAADPALLIVEIDSADARVMGGPPIRREELAKLVNRLASGGADRVLIDSYLGEGLHEYADEQLEASFAGLGKDRLALVSSSRPSDRPHPRFARHATVVDGRLTPDADGWHRKLGGEKGSWGYNAARWLADGSLSREPSRLDLRIAPRGFDQRSGLEVLSREESFKGRIVVVSVSPDIAPTRAFMPLSRTASRGAVLSIGAQSVRQDYESASRSGEIANGALYVLALVLGVLCALGASTGRRFIMQTVAGAALLFGQSIWIAKNFAVPIIPAATLGAFFIMVNVTIVQRLKIVPMMMSFLRGDVSPEEAWAWRSCEKQSHPVLLFSASGEIKRHNHAAKELIEQHGTVLARLCQPRFGAREEQIEVFDASGAVRSFQIDWPYASAPIAILRENTEALALHRELREQLLTDELTGKANRRGFDYALNRAANAGKGYAVFFIDMNGFKAVNDEFGHDAGDELLVIAGRRFAELIRRNDTLARLGGDEFAVVAPGLTDNAAASELRSRLVEAFVIPIRLTSNAVTVQVSAAVGHALAGPESDPTDTVRQADKAMYRNKLETKLQRKAA